ncbi:MAG: hypothetical protein KAV82_04840 [Phycisphaerae bacterium]|nr:hypothetical protein [Phycisphaerae bacterium]
MSKSTFTKKILLFEGVGFALVIALLWLDELLDLPHKLLGAPPTPVNWQEGIFESVMGLALATGVLLWTYRALARIHYLEGFLHVCMFCKRIHLDDEWIPIEEYISDRSEAVFSHGLCPDCKKKHYPQQPKMQ